MPLKPLGSAVFVEVIEHEPDNELVEEYNQLTKEFDASVPNRLATEAQLAGRTLGAAISKKEPQTQQGYVVAMGPDCKEVQEGDYIIFPLYSGSMVTILDETTGQYSRVFVVEESACLARFYEE